MERSRSWKQRLQNARKRPCMWVGSRGGHVRQAVLEPLRLAWEHRVFGAPRSASIRVTPRQYHTTCFANSLAPALASVVVWDQYDNLLLALDAVEAGASQETREAHRLTGPTSSLTRFAGALELAEWAVLGIRVDTVLWAQAFRMGWPITPPTELAAEPEHASLAVAASLDPRIYEELHSLGSDDSLPFFVDSVRRHIPIAARERASVEWRDEDDLFPPLGGSSHWLGDPGELFRWL